MSGVTSPYSQRSNATRQVTSASSCAGSARSGIKIVGTKKVRVTPKVEGLVDPWMHDHKLGRFQPRLFGEWITPGDYTGKYVWLRYDSELYPDDPSRTVTDRDF